MSTTPDLERAWVPTGEEFRRARIEVGVTQAAVAEAAGTSQGAISYFERGCRGIRTDTLRRAVAFLREQA